LTVALLTWVRTVAGLRNSRSEQRRAMLAVVGIPATVGANGPRWSYRPSCMAMEEVHVVGPDPAWAGLAERFANEVHNLLRIPPQ
jgi:hypothetical protein